MARFFIGFLLVLVFVGCASSRQEGIVYEKYKAPKEQKPLHVESKSTKKIVLTRAYEKPKKKQKIRNTGSIRGRIISLNKKNNSWIYEIKSNNTSNNKLSYIKFSHTKKLAKEGDLVYAIIEKSKLKEIFLIEKANIKRLVKSKKQHKKVKKKIVKKTYKKTKKHQSIGVPAVEVISLD